MNLTDKVAFKLVELFENPDESVMRLAGDAPVLIVGNCCCCCCCHCNFSIGFAGEDCGLTYEDFGYTAEGTSMETADATAARAY